MSVIADLFLGGVAVAAPYLTFMAGLAALSVWLRARGRKDAAGAGRRRGAKGARGGPPGALWRLLLPVCPPVRRDTAFLRLADGKVAADRDEARDTREGRGTAAGSRKVSRRGSLSLLHYIC